MHNIEEGGFASGFGLITIVNIPAFGDTMHAIVGIFKKVARSMNLLQLAGLSARASLRLPLD